MKCTSPFMQGEIKRNQILFFSYSQKSFGFRYKLYKDRYWFDGMYKYVEKKCKECLGCPQKRKANVSNTPLQPIPAASGIFARVHIDITGGFVDVTKIKYFTCLFLVINFVRLTELEKVSYSVCARSVNMLMEKQFPRIIPTKLPSTFIPRYFVGISRPVKF